VGTRIKPQPPRALPRWRLVSKIGSTRAGAWFFIHVGNRFDRVMVPLTKGRIRTTLVLNAVMLHHRGARSGVERDTPLVYFTDGDDVILVASKGGSPTNPAWYHNLLAHPAVEAEIGTQKVRLTARVAGPEEREKIWVPWKTANPGFAEYEAKTDREIPVVILEPAK
jgi:F420H(2)-dependent quinone reductase